MRIHSVLALGAIAAVLLFGCGESGSESAAKPSTTAPSTAKPSPGTPSNPASSPAGAVHTLDGDGWRIGTDPNNEGRAAKWFAALRKEAKPTKVPWIIQDAFPGYHGVAWYWREFDAPTNPHAGGRCLLRFRAVDYLAEVWLNGVRVGGHEGGETPFVLDVTDTIRAGVKNLLVVRVLNPTHKRIDGIVLNETPKQARRIPYRAGAAYNHGGITGSVELLATPAVRVEDLFAQAEPKTGTIRIRANVRNATEAAARGRLEFTVAPAASGETLHAAVIERELSHGDTLVEAEIKVDQPRLWELNAPFLYRVTVRVGDDERSVRCGFRDFRFENGFFRLNGRRIFLRSAHTCNHFPVGLKLPPDPDMARRDLLDLKVMGFNMIRFIWGGAERYQLDLCDEIGLMVYEESFASWPMQNSPKLAERWERSISELIRRDRNHPSVVIWGLLNEVRDSPHFRLAVESLPLIRRLDPTRMVFLNSGRWDSSGGSGRDVGDELFSKLNIWRSSVGREPWATLNSAAQPVQTPFNFTWPPRQVALHPGPQGQYSAVRWTTPAEGRYSIAAEFAGLAKATTDVHILHNGRPRFAGQLNIAGHPNTARHASELALAKGDTIDFVVGWGNGGYGSDSTALTATIKSAAGRAFDLAAHFPRKKNPAGPWSCGWLAPAEKPNAATFTLYTESKVKPRRRTGTLANPGFAEWEDVVADHHFYPRVPQTAETNQALRTMSGGDKPLFLSEYGIGSAVDLWRTTRHFERLGKTEVEDARFYRDKLDRYLADWKRWKLDELYAQPEDFFAESLRKMAGQRTLGLNAIRANPNIVGYSLTGMNDHVSCGEGLTTTFRELKPGTVDAMFEGLAPLRLCLFAEPVNVYRGARVRIEAVLANEDALAPGEYPVKLLVVGPRNQRIFEKTVNVTITRGSPFAAPIFAEDVGADGPSGRYRFLASFERGGAATGGETEFYVTDPAEMPAVKTEVVLAGEDAGLAKWLGDHGIRCRKPVTGEPAQREVIVVSRTPPAFEDVWRRVERGATVVFLSPNVLKKENRPLGWLPLANQGSVSTIRGWLYLKDEWAKRHPIFDGLPSGGLMDYTFYREIIPDTVLVGQDPPAEAVAGAIKASQDYSSGLMLAVHKSGKGRIILNTLLIRENLGTNPVAERLLRNLLNYAAGTPK
ncbi:glycoside hydrolase family 2 [bacterium]|nr:glycoside hydrolase family 2 [bacterium]